MREGQPPIEARAPFLKAVETPKSGKIMLVGLDHDSTIEKRFRASGFQVVAVKDGESAIDQTRHESFNTTVLVSKGSLLNVAETVFNLRDFNRGMEIIIIVDRLDKPSNRFLRQLLQHPIEGTRILTRRQLQRELEISKHSPPGESF